MHRMGIWTAEDRQRQSCWLVGVVVMLVWGVREDGMKNGLTMVVRGGERALEVRMRVVPYAVVSLPSIERGQARFGL